MQVQFEYVCEVQTDCHSLNAYCTVSANVTPEHDDRGFAGFIVEDCRILDDWTVSPHERGALSLAEQADIAAQLQQQADKCPPTMRDFAIVAYRNFVGAR